jgi:hypothetical protein
MGLFRKSIKHSKSSKDLDNKIKNLDEDLKKTGVTINESDALPLSEEKVEDVRYDWRKDLYEENDTKEDLTEEYVSEIREKHRKLALVEDSLESIKIREAQSIFRELYQDQVEQVVEKYVSSNSADIVTLREDLFLELNKKPNVDLSSLEEKIDLLAIKYRKLSEGLLNDPSKNSDPLSQNPVTLEQLKNHYQLLVGRLQEQLATLGGGGEVRLEFLDDVDRTTAKQDGYVLQYQSSTGKFIGTSYVSGGSGSGTQGVQGTQGIQGIQGIRGIQGIQGITGAGTQGIQGIQGPSGDGVVGSAGTWGVDSVGINTTKSVGIGTTAKDGYKLYVEGDARVTGILTVGPESITLNGIDNEILVGSGVTIYGNTGIVSATDVYSGGEKLQNGIIGIDTTGDSYLNTALISRVFVGGVSTFNDEVYYNSNVNVGTGITLYQSNGQVHATGLYVNGQEITGAGAQGTQGIIGSQGTTGTQGTIGVQGISGSQGTTGTQGAIGVQGTDGTQGAIGAGTQGATGAQGTDGIQGTDGTQGTTGTQGIAGEAAAQGIQGSTGTQGTDGTQGTTGAQGTDGTQGTTGTQGTDGAQGIQGLVGELFTAKTYTITVPGGIGGGFYIDGVQRDTIYLIRGQKYLFDQSDSGNSTHPIALSTTSDGTHNAGSQYTTGWTYSGTAGSDGVGTFIVPASVPDTLYYYCQNHSGMGGTVTIKTLTADSLQGATGAQGTQGTTGVQGTTGTQGADGTQGTDGIGGDPGAQGTQGTQGITGSGTQGTQGITGSGTQGTQGITGSGTQGVQGIQGPSGSGSGGAGYWEQTGVGINTVSNVGVGTTNPQTILQVQRYGVVTGLVQHTSQAGIASVIDSFDTSTDDFLTAEYTVHVGYGTYIQSQKVLVMQNGEYSYSQEYGVMYQPDIIVSFGATMSGSTVTLQATPETGVTGVTTYRFVRGSLL